MDASNRASFLVEALNASHGGEKLSFIVYETVCRTGSPLHISTELHKRHRVKKIHRLVQDAHSKGNAVVDSELLVEQLPVSDLAPFLRKHKIDALLFQPQCMASSGDAMVEKEMLTAAIIARYFEIPSFALLDASHIQLEAKDGETLHAKQDCEQMGASLIAGVLTEKGLARRSGDHFDLAAFLKHGYAIGPSDPQFSSFVPLTEASAIDYIKAQPKLADMIGPDVTKWMCREAGDGNLNYVYLLEGPVGGLAIKQALPYIRVVGKGWPLTQDRIRIEAKWLMTQHQLQPELVPFVHCYDETMAVVAMDYLAPPCIPLRLGILKGEIYPEMSHHIAGFLATALFFTSALALKSDDYRSKMIEFHNPELCKATEQVIFMDAYYNAPTNAYLSPELDEVARDLREDVACKVAIGKLRNLFLSKPQALVHADFHTGSVMVKEDSTYVFDSEFAFYGPMAFDIGKFLGNLLLTYFALDGHGTEQQPRTAQQKWLLTSVTEIWDEFRTEFLRHWKENAGRGDGYPEALIQVPDVALKAIQEDYMECLFGEVLGFAGACMIRRLITIAQIADYTAIQDRAARAACSRRALKLARRLLVDGMSTDHFPSIQSVVKLAQEMKTE